MVKTVALLKKIVHFFQHSYRHFSKEQQLFEIENFCNNENVFTDIFN